jgi:hypothetical protein
MVVPFCPGITRTRLPLRFKLDQAGASLPRAAPPGCATTGVAEPLAAQPARKSAITAKKVIVFRIFPRKID